MSLLEEYMVDMLMNFHGLPLDYLFELNSGGLEISILQDILCW